MFKKKIMMMSSSASLGGFGNNNTTTTTTALKNKNLSYARRAFALHFYHHYPHSQTSEQIKRTLEEQYAATNDTLYRFAQYVDPSPAVSLQKLVHYLQNFRLRKTQMCFLKCLVEAHLLEEGYYFDLERRLTAEELERFLALFRAELDRLQRAKKPYCNYAQLYNNPLLNEILTEREEREGYAQRDAILQPLNNLTQHIMEGIPAPSVIERHFGVAAARQYSSTCDQIEAHGGGGGDVDIDEALQSGVHKRWVHLQTIENAMSAVNFYLNALQAHSEYEAADLCKAFFDATDRQKQRKKNAKKEQALAWGVWRIRSTQAHLWREAFFERGEDFEEYLLLENKMKELVTRGIYQYIPRRHFSSAVARQMFDRSTTTTTTEGAEASNLDKLRKITAHIKLSSSSLSDSAENNDGLSTTGETTAAAIDATSAVAMQH